MARRIRLAGVHEASLILGISKSALADRRKHGDPSLRYQTDQPSFPTPLAELRCGPIWDANELRRYRRRYALHSMLRYRDENRWGKDPTLDRLLGRDNPKR